MLTYEDRLLQSIELLCGEKPPEQLIKDWADNTNDNLQDWVGVNGGLWWCQNIGIIDAAESMANAPIEGEQDKIEY